MTKSRIFGVIIAILLLVGCGENWNLDVPTTDLIYQSEAQVFYELSFINMDGEGFQEIELEQNFIKVSWSPEGELLYGLSSGKPPYFHMGYPAYWNVKEGKFKVCGNDMPYFFQIEWAENPDEPYQVIIHNVSEITLYDLSSCEVIGRYLDYNNGPYNQQVNGFSYNPKTQELLYALAMNGDDPIPDEYRILKLDLETNTEVQVGEGVHPAWSPDGSRIAYVGIDGLYVVDADGQNPQRIVAHKFFEPSHQSSALGYAPTPRWSPDGEWVAYHQCPNIKWCEKEETKINIVQVSTKTVKQLALGGEYPNWFSKE